MGEFPRLTAEEWDAISDPAAMLLLLPTGGVRKPLLYALACWLAEGDFRFEGSDRLFAAMSRYAEGEITRLELDGAFVAEAIHDGAPFGEFDSLEAGLYLSGALEKGVDPEMLVSLLRCIFGNPFRPVTFDPRWRSESAVALARTAYDTRNFTLLPILADALEEAGCDNADMLAHCRQPDGVHARGCWVVDLVLGEA